MGVHRYVDSLFKDSDEFDLTSGGIGKPLFYPSLPIVVQNLFQVTYNLADTFWLGRHSTIEGVAIATVFSRSCSGATGA